MTAPSDTLTVVQAAEALGVSERTVWRYLKSGRLPGETIGEPGSQRTLIPAPAVDDLRAGRAGVGAEALRAERDALRGRVRVLQRSLSPPARPGIVEWALSRVVVAASRARAPRALVR